MGKPTESEKVAAFTETLDHPLKKEIELLRLIIKSANSKIGERIKWNAPSYYYNKDIAAFNLRQQKFVQLIFIFPNGLLENDYGFLSGDWIDRREARFYNITEIENHQEALQTMLNDWITLVETKNKNYETN